ncbi:hypothetical protein THICB2_760016 [Thiomonas sp. CB2]|nr:hypothetical protein THICB2_760016 [Thiomonas sp. CB2]
MSDVGRDVTQTREALLDPGQHGVEGGRQIHEFDWNVLWIEACVQALSCHFSHARADAAQRRVPLAYG